MTSRTDAATEPQRSRFWPWWAAAAGVLNLVIGWVAALPVAWGVLAIMGAQSGATVNGPVGSAAIVALVCLAVLVPLFVLANLSLRRLVGWPGRAYWPLAVILVLVPIAVLALM